MKSRDVYIVAGIAVVGVGTLAYFFGGKLLTALKNVNKGTPYEGAGVVGTVGNVTNQVLGGLPKQLGETIASWVAPGDDTENVYYTVIFPDNSRHAVGASTVDSSGYFTYSSKRYRLGVNQANQKVAVAA